VHVRNSTIDNFDRSQVIEYVFLGTGKSIVICHLKFREDERVQGCLFQGDMSRAWAQGFEQAYLTSLLARERSKARRVVYPAVEQPIMTLIENSLTAVDCEVH